MDYQELEDFLIALFELLNMQLMMQQAFSFVANQLEGKAFQPVNAQFNFVVKKIPKKN